MSFFKDMFTASLNEDATPKHKQPTGGRQDKGKSKVINKVKSPSYTTIYAPALNKGMAGAESIAI